jgi:hypothetical protein
LTSDALNNFATSTQPLVDALNAFPKDVTIQGTHQVNVNLAGNLEGPLKDFITEQIGKALKGSVPLDARLESGKVQQV